MQTNKKLMTALCPDCEEPVRLGATPKLGEKFTCPNCWAYLELVNLNPAKLTWDEFDEDSEYEDEFYVPDEME
jgi:lysine biosynthesis protein LysW